MATAWIGLLFVAPVAQAGTLSCSVTTSCPSGTVLYRLYDPNGNHAEMPSEANYTYMVCCTGVLGLGNSCVTGAYQTVVKLSGTTNAHIEQNTEANYTGNDACLSVATGGTVSVGYQATNCAGFDTTVGSMTATTNSHVGDENAYSVKICASAAPPQKLTVAISDNSLGFGDLSDSAARYATSDEVGSNSEVEAHTLEVSSTAYYGYTVTVRGESLTNGASVIDAIGGTNSASVPGTEQFGLRMTATGGLGTVTSPYAASGFAYAATGSTPSQVASAVTGDDVITTYSIRYIANTSPISPAGAYATTLYYIVTGSF